ncbi:MlaA family lipoprotein [sulfur-oxidizing endosymbiont of Gigantopelta aegis]|uniref:MlaA family lipoprotein n=1 Tax=sulfur-oxidizing endosymbiont of Gigantopelta aegis TaxID=2794934 RepID=UPI0018DDFAC4|nr:VacJ family lipoprotein [sulfur-oxidizing endosymbiont of Gigantopelta aegis]
MKISFFRIGRYFLIAVSFIVLNGCSSVATQDTEGPFVVHETEHNEPAMNTLETLGVDENTIHAVDIYDPWEGMNRSIYNFNAQLDDYLLLPVIDGYQRYIPLFLRQGIHNIYRNFSSFNHTVNSGLQLKGKATLNNSLRFISNSTIGILGVFDVATGMGYPEMQEDFGQVLGYWGVSEGPYLVLPFFGPSNLRDGTGLVVDFYIAEIYLQEFGMNEGSEAWLYFYYGLMGIDQRDKVDFRYYDSLTPFEYDFIRMMYTAQRRILIGGRDVGK